VNYEWDPAKARANLRKHNVDFADAVAVFEDDSALSMQDPGPYEEERWLVLGMDALSRILAVVYTWRGDCIRIISARRASAAERAQYEEEP
jgi:uncharacterized DUF497 family protein